MQLQAEKAIQTTVDGKLKAAEERETAELEAAIASVHAAARPPMRPVRCGKERDACVECYRQFGLSDPLKCAPVVDALEACSADVTRGLIWKSMDKQ
jgi:hypothetical protein